MGKKLSFKYWEVVDTKSPVAWSIKDGGTRIVYPMDILWEDRITAAQEILGMSTRDGMRIKRTLPWEHPYQRHAWATEITQVQGLVPQDKLQSVAGNPYAPYQRLRLTLVFETLPFDVRTDDDVEWEPFVGLDKRSQEWRRFLDRGEFKSASESINLERGQMVFTDHPDVLYPGTPGFRIQKSDLFWTWHQVPEDYIFHTSNDHFFPFGLMAGVGCVNRYQFLSYPAGTLLALGFSTTPVFNPYRTGDQEDWKPPRLYTVTFTWKYHEKGHNNAPYQGNMNNWLPVKSKDLTSPSVPGQPPYQKFDFRNFFRAWDDTTELPAP